MSAENKLRGQLPLQEKRAGGDEFDMFTADKVDDMFADAPVGGPAMGGLAPNRGLVDSYDDPEGYYNFQVSLPLSPCLSTPFCLVSLFQFIDGTPLYALLLSGKRIYNALTAEWFCSSCLDLALVVIQKQ